MQTNMQTVSGIHCKVATQNEVRRFLLSTTEYQTLLGQICQLFGFSKDSVVIKYADDEGDFVTISSDEEVKFAIEVAKNGVLRLRADPKHPACTKVFASAPVQTPGAVFNIGQSECAKLAGDEEESSEEEESSGEFRHRKKEWKHHKKGCRMMGDPARVQSHIHRLQQKRDRLQEKLAYLDSAADSGKLGKHQLHHRDKIRAKLGFISSRLDHLSQLARQNQASGNPASSEVSPFDPSLVPVYSAPSAPASIDPTPSGPLPTKEQLVAQLETLQATCGNLRLACRQATLQMQLQRTNLQAAARASPAVSEEQLKQMRDALGTAKANHGAAKAELMNYVQKIHLCVAQLKALKHQEKAEYKCRKAAKKAEKANQMFVSPQQQQYPISAPPQLYPVPMQLQPQPQPQPQPQQQPLLQVVYPTTM